MDGNEMILRLSPRAQSAVMSAGLRTGLIWRVLPQLACLRRWFRLAGAEEGTLEAIVTTARTWSAWVDRWEAEGQAGRQRADDALADGHPVTARLLYHQAALAYVLALWREEDPERRRHLYPLLLDSYAAYGRLARFPAEPFEVPFTPAPVPAYLRLPDGASQQHPAPVVVLLQGLDTVKEMNEWAEEGFLERGIATLDVDEPGIGEARMRGITLSGVDALRTAAGAIADAVAADPRLDHNRLAVCGWSFGAFVAPYFAAVEPRYTACATLGVMWAFPSPEGMADNPLYGPPLRQYTGTRSREELVDVLRELTLAPVASGISIPIVAVQGGDDRLLARDAHKLREAMPNGSLVHVVKGDDHGVTWHRDREVPLLWDWIADHLK